MSGLYVHIPFCRAKCAYCDFYSGPLRGFGPEAYSRALLQELEARSREVSDDGLFDTIYIGGGTPSSIPVSLLRSFLRLGRPGAEVTVEVNPEDVSERYAAELVAVGVNRIGMGVQTLNDRELSAIGRRHTAAQAVAAYRALRRAGVANVSLDLIYGLPHQTLESWQRTLSSALALEPDHLSAYLLSYEPGTLLHTRMLTGRHKAAPEELVVNMYQWLCAEAERAGMSHYEISNFARPGMHSRHNSSYWDGTPYLGLGPGAHSYDGTLRRFNPPNLKAYMANPTTAFRVDEEDDTNRHNDLIMTALRTSQGLDPSVLNSRELIPARRLLRPTPEGRLRIAEADWLRADSIILNFIR